MGIELLQQALKAHRTGDLPSAARLYERVLRQAPGNFDALHLLGVVRARQRDFPEAARLIGKALASNPASPDAHSNLDNALLEMGRPAEAAGRFRRALAIRPGHVDAQFNLGNALRDLEDIDGAVAAYQAAIRLQPAHRNARINLAVLLQRTNRAGEAIVQLRPIIAANPMDAAAHNALGLALQEVGDMAAARAAFEHAIALAPRMAGAYFNWAYSAKVAPGAPLLAAMAALAEQAESLPAKERTVLNFALGKAYEDIGRLAPGPARRRHARAQLRGSGRRSQGAGPPSARFLRPGLGCALLQLPRDRPAGGDGQRRAGPPAPLPFLHRALAGATSGIWRRCSRPCSSMTSPARRKMESRLPSAGTDDAAHRWNGSASP